MTELARKQDNLLRQAEDADPADPFIQGLKSRFNELDAEGDTVRERLAELDQQDRYDHAPEPGQVELLEALPKLQVNLHHAPPQLLGRLFDLVQLTIRVHYATDEATVTMRLPGDEILGLQTLSEGLNQDEDTSICTKGAGRSQCATCTCPRAGSCRPRTESRSGRARTEHVDVHAEPLVLSVRLPLVMQRRGTRK